jgi:hypothetical protein
MTEDTILYKSIFLFLLFSYQMIRKWEKNRRRKFRDGHHAVKTNKYA